MLARVRIDFACNDPDNGGFAGKVWTASYGDAELETRHGGDITFTEGDGWIRLHRRKFGFVSSVDWIGNWCWNGYWLERAEAKRLLLTMRANGWRCTCGGTRFYEWFNRGQEP